MLDNHLYNLMRQIVEENTSLWRIKNEYQKDHGGCAECEAFWQKMQKDKEDRVNELLGLIKSHLK